MAERNIISDKLLLEKTGKGLQHWYSLLDKKGAKKLDSKDIFHLVSKIPELDPLGEWNQNLMTTAYQWDRGLKERGEKKDGFEISVSKTVNASVSELYVHFIRDSFRKKWLGNHPLTITTKTLDKSCRISLDIDKTRLSIDFYVKSAQKSQVVVQHQKIKSKNDADELKLFWKEKLGLLSELLEM